MTGAILDLTQLSPEGMKVISEMSPEHWELFKVRVKELVLMGIDIAKAVEDEIDR
jgi:hypothetical protein